MIANPDPLSVPANAPDHCPGTESELAGKTDACAGCANQETCSTMTPQGPDPALPLIKDRMKGVKRKILVLSGKGGVGKSTFTAQLSWAFAADEDCQVRLFSGTFLLPHLFSNSLSGWRYGRRHLRSLNTYNSWHRIRTSPFFIFWLVARLRPGQPRSYVCRVHAPLRT